MGKFRWDALEGDRLNDQVTRKMFWGDKIMVTEWQLAPNVAFPVHQHESEQISMVQEGEVTLVFPEEEDVTLGPGDMYVVKSMRPHGVKVGASPAKVVDLFSPIREDFLAKSESYLTRSSGDSSGSTETSDAGEHQQDPHARLKGFLDSIGIHVELEKLQEVPLNVLARYCYEKECITMGQLRNVLGLDKQQAKNLLREWKHGDDHSESSLRRKIERMIVLKSDLKLYRTT
jgi:hypothetical protein